MAIGQLLLTYPSQTHVDAPAVPTRICMRPSSPASASSSPRRRCRSPRICWETPRIPVELWGLVFGGALLAWGLAEACSRLVWRQHGRGGAER